ncbi:hypothetical protein [Dissulfurispira sp.]|uniref:hypothetical protein n=1 Tax=Dissulfurispira sp. TaxID=2817609 RepID=UPI002FD8D028
MSAALPLREYLYLDDSGIESLYAQTVSNLEIEKTSTLEKSISGKAGIKLKFKQILLEKGRPGGYNHRDDYYKKTTMFA